MSVLIYGNGCREEVIKEKINDSLKINKVDLTNDKSFLIENKNNYDLIIIGSEQLLVDGIKDIIGDKCFGPHKKGALIEGDKEYSKHFMKNNNIPTSNYGVFNNYKKSIEYCKKIDNNKIVIKKCGLANGKGVFIPHSLNDSIKYLNTIYNENEYEKIIIEDKVYGIEVSVMGFCNGKDIQLMPQVQDYKKIYDDDKGENTGGMGSICPVNILSEKELESVKNDMLKVVNKHNYIGVLYAGIMKTKDSYNILEFNCRFGDPETQVVLNLLKNDLYDIMLSCINGEDIKLEWKDGYCANVVLSHIDYPFSKLKEPIIINKGILDKDIKLYNGNISIKDNLHYTTGGRVYSMTHYSNNLQYSLEKIYNNIYKIEYEGLYYRRDIGLKYLLNQNNKKKIKIGIISSSRGTSIIKLLEKQKELNVKVELIISNKNSLILDKGKEHKIDTFYLPNNDYKKMINLIDIYELDMIFAVGYMNIFPDYFCDRYHNKLFNIHPSLLPNYKGFYGDIIHKKVLEKEMFSGCTLHKISSNVDCGDIVLQKQYKIEENETFKSLKENIQELESNCIIEYIQLFKNKNINYKDSGVDIHKGNDFTKMLSNSKIGGFCGIYEINGMKLGASCDGVGTKLDLANKYNKLEHIGIDLVAMCVNDLIVCGIKPLFFLDYIAIDTLDTNKLNIIISSIKKGCETSGCILLGGETAEMPNIYKFNGFDLGGFSVGILKNELYPKTELIEKGCKLYGLKSNGIHSNGYSLVNKLLKYYDYDIDTLLKPTKIYMECFDIIEKYKDDLLGMGHITGGGLIDNIKRIIPSNLDIKLNIKIENEFKWIMEKSKMDKIEMMNTFNCGYGIILIFKKEFVNDEFEEIGYIF